MGPAEHSRQIGRARLGANTNQLDNGEHQPLTGRRGQKQWRSGSTAPEPTALLMLMLCFFLKKRCPYSVVFSLLIITIDSLGSFKKIIVSRKLSTIIIQVPGDGADANSAEDYPHQT